jgi:pimeloyl-ACP methyl ester carboxylesterase
MGYDKRMLLSLLSVFLITLGLGQIMSTVWQIRGVSLVGDSKSVGYGLGATLLLLGAIILPNSWIVLGWVFLAGPLALGVLLLGGSYLFPPPDPNQFFSPDHPAHSGCRSVEIPDGDVFIPGLLLLPKSQAKGRPAVCVVPGAGAHKTFFTSRLVRALLKEGFVVLTIDMPGHGSNRRRTLTYPNCLSTVSAALTFLRQQSGVTRIGLIGISLGGAMAIESLVKDLSIRPDALVVAGTPTHLDYTRVLFYGELWNTIYGSPMLSLLQEMSIKQVRQVWKSGGYNSRHTTAELFAMLKPLENIKKIGQLPLLLVYSNRDKVAPPAMARAMQQAAPHAQRIQEKKASHVMLTLIPAVNRQIARWLREQLN